MSERNQPGTRRTYTPEFKQQIVDLYHSGKRKCDSIREYDMVSSLLDKWIAPADKSGSFHKKDSRTPEQEELLKFRKENQRLLMEK